MSNRAYIDGQNLTRGTMGAAKPWKIDLRKFRVFLIEKYGVSVAYYFIGIHNNKYDKLYTVEVQKYLELSAGK